MLQQFTVIIVMSVAAGYAFLDTDTVYKVNEIGFFRYVTYALAVFFGYLCFSRYKKSVALGFSAALSVLAFSPLGPVAIELFPFFAPLLAVLMGLTTVLVYSNSKGRGFFEFIFALVLPAVLEKSRIIGSMSLLATTKSLSNFEVAAVTACVVGGYFYLRYMMLANVNRLVLLSNGGSSSDVSEVSRWFNKVLILGVVGASGTAMSLMIATSVVAEALRGTFFAVPTFVLALALSAGITLTAILYIFQLMRRGKH